MRDLYDVDLSKVGWIRPCGGNVGQEGEYEGEACVEIAKIPGGGVAVRDSKRPDLPGLRFTAAEWAAFTATV